jgi:hypothetical protein
MEEGRPWKPSSTGNFSKLRLPADWKEQAVTMALMRPQPPQHAKVTDIEQVLRPLMHRVGLNHSLLSTRAEAALPSRMAW